MGAANQVIPAGLLGHSPAEIKELKTKGAV
jgi:hypothetical protein